MPLTTPAFSGASGQCLGVLSEKNGQWVSLVPSAVRQLTADGWTIVVQSGCGVTAGFSDEAYLEKGLRVTDCATVIRESNVLLALETLLQG